MNNVIAATIWAAILSAFVLSPLTAKGASEPSLPDPRHYAISQVGDDIGLGTVEALSILQDRAGFLWIGTSEGLLRYDGKGFRRFRTDDGLPDLWVSDLRLAPDGTLWAATDNGVARYDGAHFTALKLPGMAIDSSHVNQKFAFDGRGNIYLATSSGLISTSIENPSKIRRWAATLDAVFGDSKGTIWFVSARRLYRITPATGVVAALPFMLPDETSIAILQGQGKLWVRTTGHLGYVDGKRFVLDDAGIAKASAYGIPAVDRAGRLLVPSVAGLFRERSGRWERIARAQGTSANAVTSVAQDLEGAYWLGYEGHGIMRWPGPNEWTGWTESEGLPDSTVDSILRDPKGRLWVGTINGLAMWDEHRGRWQTWSEQNGLGGSRVQYMAVAPDGAIIALCYPHGITRIDPHTLQAGKISSAALAPSTIAALPRGQVWIGSQTYLKTLVTVNGRYDFRDVIVPADAIGTTHHISLSPDGTVWMGGSRGVSRLSNGRWTRYTTKQGLRSDRVWDLAAVSRAKACVIYEQWLGITCLQVRNGKIRAWTYDEHSGLPVDYTGYFIEADRRGRVWTGGAHGLTRIDPNGKLRRFTHDDGLIWDDISESAFWEDRDGAYLIGTSGGLARYAPLGGFDPSLRAPSVALTSVTLGNRQLTNAVDPRVPYGDNSLQVDFAALTFRDSDMVLCKYRLGGLESAFTVTKEREVRYGGLPSGSYVLETACRSAAGVWSAPSKFAFIIERPWWELWWVRALEVLLAASAITAIVRYRTRHLEAERARLEEAVAQRNAELALVNQELAAANAELVEASLTDPLTRLHNRRYFQHTIAGDVSRCLRQLSDATPNPAPNLDIVLYFVDIDQFKSVNDRYGHAIGDAMLVEAANRINLAMRRSDRLIRWGGEEFLVVSYPTKREKADILAQRIMRCFSKDPFVLSESISIQKTCSIGWAPFPWFIDRPDVLNYEEVLKLADQALYMAKESGRNRAVGFVPIGDRPHVDGAHVPFETLLTPGPVFAKAS